MPCPYFNQQKDNAWAGIYCNRADKRVPVKFWSCYCKISWEKCPYNGGSDPYELVNKKPEPVRQESRPAYRSQPAPAPRSSEPVRTPDDSARYTVHEGGYGGGRSRRVSKGLVALRIWLVLGALCIFELKDVTTGMNDTVAVSLLIGMIAQLAEMFFALATRKDYLNGKRNGLIRAGLWLVTLAALAVCGLSAMGSIGALTMVLVLELAPPLVILLLWWAKTRFF